MPIEDQPLLKALESSASLILEFGRSISRVEKSSTDLSSDLKNLRETIHGLEIRLADYGIVELKLEVKGADQRLRELESFKSNVVGALFAMNAVWALIAYFYKKG